MSNRIDIAHESWKKARVREMTSIFKRTIEKWGIDKQIPLAMEECGELIAAMNQYFFRGRINKHHLASEIADVEIVCLQLRELLGNNIVDEWKKTKLDRLEKRLNEY